MRRAYHLILRLHPQTFRRRFEAEMLAVFDEALQTEGPLSLIIDGIRSLLRQRVLRPYPRSRTTQRPGEASSTSTNSLFIAHPPPPMHFHSLLLGAAISASLFVIACGLIGRGGRGVVERRHVYLPEAKSAEGLTPSDLTSVSDECANGVGPGCQTEAKHASTAFHSPSPNVLARRDELPFPSGSFGIGQVSYSFSSSGALTRGAANSEFKLLIWYPAATDPNTSVPVDNVWQYSKSAAKWVQTHTVANATIAGSYTKYPLILFAPARRNESSAYLSQIENLVSHGYVVACFQGADASNEITFEDTRLTDFEADMRRAFFFPGIRTTEGILARVKRFEQARETAECAKVRFALNQLILLATDHSEHAPFMGHVDLEHVGAFGHASGGSAVAELCASDLRISACVDEDGWTSTGLFAQRDQRDLPRQPFLFLDLPLKQPRADALAYAHMGTAEFRRSATLAAAASDRQLRSATRPAYKLSLLAPNLTDKNFTDAPLVWSMRQGRIEDREARSALAIINVYARTFFDEYLKNEAAPLLDSSGISAFPAVNIQRYGAQ
jgi:Platelet-activating factor acetylhydrolase, isoform II